MNKGQSFLSQNVLGGGTGVNAKGGLRNNNKLNLLIEGEEADSNSSQQQRNLLSTPTSKK
jgi:hypothetical protein